MVQISTSLSPIRDRLTGRGGGGGGGIVRGGGGGGGEELSAENDKC